jgi:predicted dinucleotide-binding enzyme
MQIAIIGTGNVGAALGQRWAAAGHDILFGVRQLATGSAWPMGLGRVQISGSACYDGKLHQPPSHTACVQ